MFGFSFDPIRRSGRLAAVLAMVVSSFALVALSAPTQASAAFGADRKPVASGAVSTTGESSPVGTAPAAATDQPQGEAEEHGMGLVLPTTFVNNQANLTKLSASAQSLLPASADLFANTLPRLNQGQVGSCVTWAIDYAMLGWYSKRDNRAVQTFNPMYTYSQIRNPNSVEPNGGSDPVTALNYAQSQGNDSMAHYSHAYTDYVSLPNASERANALNYRISGWQTVIPKGTIAGTAGADLIKQALANGKPVAFSVRVRTGMDSAHMLPHTSAVYDDDISTPVTGGHEVLAVGYDQYGLWFQNSWGPDYGYLGYGRLSWRVVATDVYEAETISGLAAAQTTTDTTAPTMGAVNQQFQLAGLVTGSTVPVQFSWSATDAVGVTGYEVWVKTDAGAYVKDTSVAANATSIGYNLLIGHTYQVAVTARDAAANWSAYSYSVSVTPGATDDKAYATTTTWGRYNLADSFGGTYMAASQAGASFSYPVTGRDIALIGPKFSNAGRATLYCDGTSYGLLDEYSATTAGRQVVAWCHFAQSGQHTLKVVLEGTSGRPWFGVDAFAFLS